MLTRQRKAGRGVIKRRRLPRRGGVACCAILVKLGQLVIWFGGLIVVGLVAGKARGRRPCILRCMAGDASCLLMRTGQRKGRRIVVILRRNPGSYIVTEGAVMGESTGFMIRIRGRSKVVAMAGVAVTGGPSISIRVATNTGDSAMSSRQREACRMIVCRGVPACRRCFVTGLTV